MAAKIVDQIKSGKKISRGWIGVGIQDVDENTAKALGLKDANGALVGSVMEGEPASKAGMKDGDIIVAVDNKEIEDAAALLRVIADKTPGSKASIKVWRDGKTTELTVTLGERKTTQSAEQNDKDQKQKNEGLLGISVRPLTDEERRDLKIEKNEGLLMPCPPHMANQHAPKIAHGKLERLFLPRYNSINQRPFRLFCCEGFRGVITEFHR